jgi:hypothetical protein
MLKLRRSRLGGSIGVVRVVIWASLAQRVVELIVGHIVADFNEQLQTLLETGDNFRRCLQIGEEIKNFVSSFGHNLEIYPGEGEKVCG